MKLKPKVLFGVAILALTGSFCGFFAHIVSPRIVSRAVAPDGTEMCIVQEFNWDAEPFTTSFVYRRPGGRWGRFYMGHQDDFWSRCRAALNPDRGIATFDYLGSPMVTFAWATETYTLHHQGRTITGAQWQMPDDWNPRRSVKH
jgi:hypothetical protein